MEPEDRANLGSGETERDKVAGEGEPVADSNKLV